MLFRISATKQASFEIKPHTAGRHYEAVDFEVEFVFEINPEGNFILYKTQVSIWEKDTKNTLASIIADTIYQLDQFDMVVRQVGTEYVIDAKMNHIMSRIAAGVTRGFLAAELQKTYLSHVTLPLLPIELQ